MWCVVCVCVVVVRGVSFVVCRLLFVVCRLLFLLLDRKKNREVHRRIHGIALLLPLHDIRLSVGSACGNYGAVVVLFCCSGAVVGSGPVAQGLLGVG